MPFGECSQGVGVGDSAEVVDPKGSLRFCAATEKERLLEVVDLHVARSREVPSTSEISYTSRRHGAMN